MGVNCGLCYRVTAVREIFGWGVFFTSSASNASGAFSHRVICEDLAQAATTITEVKTERIINTIITVVILIVSVLADPITAVYGSQKIPIFMMINRAETYVD